MKLEIYGCWLQHIDAIFGPQIPGYIVMAMCEGHCHGMRHLITDEEMDMNKDLNGLFAMIHETILRAFNKVHPRELEDADRR